MSIESPRIPDDPFIEKSKLQGIPKTQRGDGLKISDDVVKKDGLLLKHATKKSQANKKIVLAAVKENGLALQYADDTLKNDPDIVKAAFIQNPSSLYAASDRLREQYSKKQQK